MPARFIELLIHEREFCGALRDLLLHFVMSLLESSGHLVEFLGERFDLITRLQIDTMVQIAAADALHSFAETFEGAQHSARDQPARKQCHSESDQKQGGCTQ